MRHPEPVFVSGVGFVSAKLAHYLVAMKEAIAEGRVETLVEAQRRGKRVPLNVVRMRRAA